MSSFLIGLLSALAATNSPTALSNFVISTTGITITSAASTNDPIELELEKIMDADDDARTEVDGWIRENDAFAAQGAGLPAAELNQRIQKRFDVQRQAYEGFIKRHPQHAQARIAYASFLHELGDEDSEVELLEKARELDPKNPAAWNQLANYHGHRGPTTNAFICYEKAIELNPTEPVYYWNFATTVYLFRKAATEHYHITEQQVFDKALALYVQAQKLDPTNFVLATDLAQSYYGIRPVRTDEALNAYTNALRLASDEAEREGVYLHLARFKYNAGRFAEARAHLDAVTLPRYAELKKKLIGNLEEKELAAKGTNRPPTLLPLDAPTPAAAAQPLVKTNPPPTTGNTENR